MSRWNGGDRACSLGSNGQIIVDVIPEVELIIGQQPPVLEVEPLKLRIASI